MKLERRFQLKKFKTLVEQHTYTMLKLVRINVLRNRVFVTRPLKQFQSDLCDMKNLAKPNDGYNYLLTVIDIFSKRAFVRAVKRKTATEVVKAFESVFKDRQILKKLQTDAGTEFFKKNFKALMKKYGIVNFATASETKASVIERFNCTLKTRMWRYFTANNTHRYIDVLQDLVRSCNHNYHSSIK